MQSSNKKNVGFQLPYNDRQPNIGTEENKDGPYNASRFTFNKAQYGDENVSASDDEKNNKNERTYE